MLCSCSESDHQAQNSSYSNSSLCGPGDSEVRFVYQDLENSPEEDEPSAPPVIAKLPSPICLPDPQSPGHENNSLENGDIESSGTSKRCQGHQSMFLFNLSSLNPGHIIIAVVTNDSRITK